MMFAQILDIVKSTSGIGQFLVVAGTASLGAIFLLVLIKVIGKFTNNTNPSTPTLTPTPTQTPAPTTTLTPTDASTPGGVYYYRAMVPAPGGSEIFP
jgi:hypothetical protein